MRYAKHSWMLVGLCLAASLAGCLPVELSVSSEGNVLIPRAEGFVVFKPADGSVSVWNKPADGQAAFAQYAPDGKSALVFTQTSGGMGKTYSVMLLSADGATKSICSKTNITYAQWSPDGKYATITRVADEKVAPIDQNMPELILISVADGMTKSLANNVAGIHRWMPDSKNVVIFQIESKGQNSNQYAGKLMLLDVTGGEKKALASMAGEQGAFFDVSPDGKAAMVTALKIDAPDAKMPEKVEGQSKLFALNMETGQSKEISQDVGFAIYSPNGSKVLIGASTEKEGAITLSVATADGSAAKQIVTDAAKQTGGGMGGSATIYPVWQDDDTLLYLCKYAVYGPDGTNLMLTTVKADGSAKEILQSKIDTALIGK